MEEEDQIKQEVSEYCERRKIGARPTNKSAAQDYRTQMTQMNNEVGFLLLSLSYY